MIGWLLRAALFHLGSLWAASRFHFRCWLAECFFAVRSLGPALRFHLRSWLGAGLFGLRCLPSATQFHLQQGRVAGRLQLRQFIGTTLAPLAWWGKQRHWRNLAVGLPALAVLGTALTLALLGMSAAPALTDNYEAQAGEALRRQDYATAEICYEKLLRRHPSVPAFRFGLAVCWHQLGQTERAERLIHRLAPDQTAGYPPAHLWRARALLADWDHSHPAAAVLSHHLAICLRHFPEEWLALAAVPEQRVEPGLLVVPPQPRNLSLTLAQLYQTLENEAASRTWGQRAYAFYQQAAPEGVEPRLSWAEAALLLRDFRGAVTILEEGWHESQAARYHQPLAEAYALLALEEARRSGSNPAERVDLVRRGLEHDPENALLLGHLIALSQQPGEPGQAARALVQQLQEGSAASASLYLCLGINAWQRGQAGPARGYLEKAHTLAPENPVIGNNFAYVLARGPQANPARALDLINQVLREHPQDPHYRETRGEVLAKLGRWSEALPDLEFAASGLVADRSLHLLLSEAYVHLDQPTQAAAHRAQAAALARAEPTRPRGPIQEPQK